VAVARRVKEEGKIHEMSRREFEVAFCFNTYHYYIFVIKGGSQLK